MQREAKNYSGREREQLGHRESLPQALGPRSKERLNLRGREDTSRGAVLGKGKGGGRGNVCDSREHLFTWESQSGLRPPIGGGQKKYLDVGV